MQPPAGRIDPDARLDIVRDVCPMTWVKTKLELEEMAPGQVLEVRVRAGESHHNVSLNARDAGCALLGDSPDPQGGEAIRLLLIRKGAARAS
jgi:tRNA 2-thiouridine synthesizing protein A